ncbi:MAG: nuclease, partial [Chloroflexota bacterium]
GQWGYLDHALATASMTAQVSGVADYHINADEPSVLDYNTDFKSASQIASLYAPDQFRVSDHDPVLVGLCLPPSLDVTLSTTELFPVNHKYVDVNATINASSDTTLVELLSVISNEPDDSTGDGKTINDIVIIDNDSIQLRAERTGNGSDRVYTITYQATNSCGATTTATALVTVPHNK